MINELHLGQLVGYTVPKHPHVIWCVVVRLHGEHVDLRVTHASGTYDKGDLITVRRDAYVPVP